MIIYQLKYSKGFSEYLRIKKNITDEGSEKHVNDITGCKPGCNMFKYKTTLKEKLRILSTEHDQVLIQINVIEIPSHIIVALKYD